MPYYILFAIKCWCSLFITLKPLAKIPKMDEDLITTQSQTRNRTSLLLLILHFSNNILFASLFTSYKFTTINNLTPGMSVSFSPQSKMLFKTSRN